MLFVTLNNKFKAMNSGSLNKVYNLKLSLREIINLIKGFSIEDKIILEKEIEKETLAYRALAIDNTVKENTVELNDIVTETRKVRKRKKHE